MLTSSTIAHCQGVFTGHTCFRYSKFLSASYYMPMYFFSLIERMRKYRPQPSLRSFTPISDVFISQCSLCDAFCVCLILMNVIVLSCILLIIEINSSTLQKMHQLYAMIYSYDRSAPLSIIETYFYSLIVLSSCRG